MLLPTGHRDSHELLCEITAEPVYQSNQRHRVSGSGSRSLGPRDGGDCDDPPQGPAGGEGDGPPGCGVCSPLWDPGFVSQHLSPKFSRLFHPDSFLLNRELKEKKKKVLARARIEHGNVPNSLLKNDSSLYGRHFFFKPRFSSCCCLFGIMAFLGCNSHGVKLTPAIRRFVVRWESCTPRYISLPPHTPQ